MSIFTGAGVALVTPFKEDLSVDYDQLEKFIDFQIDNGKIITDTDFDNMLKIYNRKQIFKCRVIDKLIDIPMNLKKDIKVRRLEGNHLEVEFDNQKIDIKELLEELSRYVSFSDVSIESMSIEDIVKKILIRKEQ
jgi:ABC-2 type transport system ATP-binding protein